MGISSEGSKFRVLQSFILSIPNPEAAISTPPTIEISVTSASGIILSASSVSI